MHSGSHIAVYKDLIGDSSVFSDVTGFLIVKEIFSSEFPPKVEKEPSSSELVLEAVKITGKVIKIIDKQVKKRSLQDFCVEHIKY